MDDSSHKKTPPFFKQQKDMSSPEKIGLFLILVFACLPEWEGSTWWYLSFSAMVQNFPVRKF